MKKKGSTREKTIALGDGPTSDKNTPNSFWQKKSSMLCEVMSFACPMLCHRGVRVKGGDEGERMRARVLRRLVCLEVRVRLVFGSKNQDFSCTLVQSGDVVNVSVLLGGRRFCRLG